MAKYDWIALKREYITGEYSSLKDFSDRNGINYSLLRRKAKSGWIDEKVTRETERSQRVIEKVTKAEVDSEVDRTTRILTAYDTALTIALDMMEQYKGVSKKDAYTLEKLTAVLERIQKGHKLGTENASSITAPVIVITGMDSDE